MKIIKLLAGHKVTPVKPINKVNSRFAYKIKGHRGLFTLEGVEINSGKFRYKKYSK